jgi:uncharacterized protein (DUF3084 family)
MTTGLVLIAAILVLGGVIATVGDRLGMRVGKARLSLFNLRPRQTATVITILTGSIISASTFGILFAVSDQLRTGVFELSEIQDDLRTARQELEAAATEKRRTERELNQAIRRQRAARQRLSRINRSLRQSIAQQERTEAQLNRSQAQLAQTQARLQQIQTNFQQAQTLLETVSEQANRLRSEIQQLQTERQALIERQEQVRQQIAQRDRDIAEREQAIAERDRAIVEREALLQDLENQRTFLVQAVQNLEREFQGLREGNVALLRNEPLASGVVRVVDPAAAPQAVAQLLREANETAIRRINPGATNVDRQVIQITNAAVEQLIEQIDDGREYVVRILSEGNYVVGEPSVLAGEEFVQVYAVAARNQIVYLAGEVVAEMPVDPTTMSNARLIERLNLLIVNSQLRARQDGLLSDTIQIADGRTETIIAFFDRIQQYNQRVQIQAIAAETTSTAGPLRIELVAVQNGQVLFSTEPAPRL